jgi:DivIVA domain-containing protein
MEASGGPALNASTFRNATFGKTVWGYDPRAVHEFLERIAEWIEQHGELSGDESQLTREFARVGERTTGILTAAEEAAMKLRADAKAYADSLRAEAEEEARATRLNASQHADELVSKAQEKADHVIEEAVTRRRMLNQSLAGLQERRDEVAQETQRLADDLLAAIEALRVEEPEAANGAAPVAEEAVPEPADDESAEQVALEERETAVHRAG